MTARLYLTVYAADDLPTETAHIASKSLGTVTSCTELVFTKHLYGTDDLKLKINRHHPDAALLIADRYVIVHSDAGPIGGAFLEQAPIDLSAAEGKGDEWMEWSGRGPISVLERVVMDNDSNLTGGHNPINGFWDLSAQGDFAGNSNGHPIPMMKRVLNEVAVNPPNGISMVDHSSWDYDLDSDGATPPFWGEIIYGADVGDDALSLAAEMSQLGDIVWETTHLFAFNAYLSYGTVRTGAFGAAGKVRFEKGVNIADAIQRTIRGSVLRTHLVVGGANRTYVKVTDPDYVTGDVVRWGFLSMPETDDTTALSSAGLANIEARKRQTDVWSFPQHDHGNDIAAGIYEPAPPGTANTHYWVGDTVTLHSGTGVYDANALAVPISAITWELKTGEAANGDYWVIPQVGATFNWPPPGPGQQHIPPAPPSGSETNFLCGLPDANIIASGVGIRPKIHAADCDDATWWNSNAAPVSNQWWAADAGSVQTAERWRIHQGGSGGEATAVTIYGTSDAAKWTALASGGPGYNFAAAGWTAVTSLAGLVALSNTGTLSGSYRYWAFRATAGGSNGWDVFEFELGEGADTTSPVGDSGSAGTPGTYAPLDHVHAHGTHTTDYHTNYVQESDANWVDLTDGGATTLHSHTGGGVTDHGALTGLADDDHPQYLRNAELDTAGHYEVLMTGASPAEPLEDGSGTDWLYVWVS